MRQLILCFGALALLTASAGLAQKRPERIHLTEQSRQGAILIRVPVYAAPYSFQFSRNGNSGFLSRVYQMGVQAGPSGYRYIARTLSPGRYRLDTITQQALWSACLQHGTIEVPIVAGRIAYVGTLEIEPVLRSIQRDAIERGRTEVRGVDIVISRDETARPVVEGRDPASLEAARTLAETVMNGSGRLVELADVSNVDFQVSGANRAIEICG